MDDDATAALLWGPTPTARWRARADGARHDGAVGPHLQPARGAAAGTRDPHGAHPQGPSCRRDPRRAAPHLYVCVVVSLDLFLLRRGGVVVPRGAADLRCCLRPPMGYGHAGRHCSSSLPIRRKLLLPRHALGTWNAAALAGYSDPIAFATPPLSEPE